MTISPDAQQDLISLAILALVIILLNLYQERNLK